MTATGAMIMSVFAAIWWIVGARFSGYGSLPMYAIPIVATAAVLTLAMRNRSAPAGITPEEERRRGRVVGYASAAEGVAILIAFQVLGMLGKIGWGAPVVAIIVGLHFLPLARWLPARPYYITSGVLVVVGGAGFGVADSARRLLIVSAGAATVLWLTSAAALRAIQRRRAPA
jgi:hypothetical protein